MQNFEFKRGSTLELEITLTDSVGAPLVYDVGDMRAEVRDSTSILAVLDITTTETPGVYIMRSDVDTSGWAFGVVYTDIRITSNGKTIPVFIY